jgi:hypothetical protein
VTQGLNAPLKQLRKDQTDDYCADQQHIFAPNNIGNDRIKQM